MAHLLVHLFEGLLRWLGIDQKSEFAILVLLYVAWFLAYAGNQFWREKVYSLLYLLLGMSVLLFLFSEEVPGRVMGACGFAASVITMFGWYFLRRAGTADK